MVIKYMYSSIFVQSNSYKYMYEILIHSPFGIIALLKFCSLFSLSQSTDQCLFLIEPCQRWPVSIDVIRLIVFIGTT